MTGENMARECTSSGSGRWYIWLLVVAILIGVSHTLLYRDCSVEDSYIAFKYIDNWYRGNGFTYNVGEPVEGYSNFLWLVFIGAGRVLKISEAAHWLGGLVGWLPGESGDVLCARILGTIIFALIILIGATMVRRQFGTGAGAGAALLLALSFPLSFYSVTGLETGFFTLLLTVTVFRYLDNRCRIDPMTVLLLHLVAVSRVEGVLYFFPFFGYDLFSAGKWHRRHTLSLAVFSVLGLGFISWRWWYFGSVLPQVFFARFPLNDPTVKLPWILRGFDDMVLFIRSTGGILGGLLILCSLGSKMFRRRVGFLLWVIAAGLVFQKFAGGDFMLGARYLIPVLPCYLACLLGAVSRVVDRLSKDAMFTCPLGNVKLPLIVTLAVIWGIFQFSQTVEFLAYPMRYPNFLMHSRTLRTTARWLKERYDKNTVLSCWRFGAVGYVSGLKIRDLEGIVVRDTGRNRFRRALGLEPGIERERPAPDLILEPFSTDIHLEEKEVSRYDNRYRLIHLFPIAEGVTWRLLEIVPGEKQ